MLDSLPVSFFVGITLGVLAGLGVGGGSLLLLWLTLILNIEHEAARIINLLFFIPSAVIASIFRWKRGDLQLIKIIPAIIAGCVSASIFSVIGNNIDTIILKKLFGCLLLFTGFRELFYRSASNKKASGNN